MDPITLAILAYTAFTIIIYVSITISTIVDWFHNRSALKEENKQLVAFTLADRLNGKQYAEVSGVFGQSTTPNRVIQGLYDKGSNKIVDARKVLGRKVDDDVVAQHQKGAGLVVYS